ncbi:unnamed protein product [Strongylus vulgaris]|uniref:Uncharacterized protein n=1 Tax=Strongylus vulgaris TaxID=40348 RepID=A0A3P7KUT7_STRVU|nr:unnamed protein product [Strongylus vulgaris]
MIIVPLEACFGGLDGLGDMGGLGAMEFLAVGDFGRSSILFVVAESNE